jgi:hypothetical protein
LQKIKCEVVLARGGLSALDLEKAGKTNTMDHHLKNEDNPSDALSFLRSIR